MRHHNKWQPAGFLALGWHAPGGAPPPRPRYCSALSRDGVFFCGISKLHRCMLSRRRDLQRANLLLGVRRRLLMFDQHLIAPVSTAP